MSDVELDIWTDEMYTLEFEIVEQERLVASSKGADKVLEGYRLNAMRAAHGALIRKVRAEQEKRQNNATTS